jgi:hypothetical protein
MLRKTRATQPAWVATNPMNFPDDRLPAPDHRSGQFRQMVHDTYLIRG